jgi:hypothetical protein
MFDSFDSSDCMTKHRVSIHSRYNSYAGITYEIDHVGTEQRLAVLLEVLLVGVHHAVEPREKFLGAMVGVQDHGDVVEGGDGADVVGAGDRTCNRSSLVLNTRSISLQQALPIRATYLVIKSLASEELTVGMRSQYKSHMRAVQRGIIRQLRPGTSEGCFV